MNRKSFAGDRTNTGARAQEILTSILVTARLQELDPIDELIELQRSTPGTVIAFDLTSPDTQAEIAA